jgi:hypothetical protein
MATAPRRAAKPRANPFAHLLNPKRSRAEEPKEDPEGDEEDGDACDACDGAGEIDGEECDDCNGTGKKPEDDGKKSKKSKKSKRAEDEDDERAEDEDDDDEEKAQACRNGRAFERARCETIFSSAAAGSRPDLAAHLAFETDMGATKAVKFLERAASGAHATDPRRAARPRVDLTESPAPARSGPGGLAAQIVAAGKKRRGES